MAITLLFNGLGAFGIINGMSQQKVSAKYPTFITPAGFTFSIWSVIYILLFASVLVLYWKRNEDYYKKFLDKGSLLFWISCILNILWVIVFSFEMIGISFILIFLFLITLLFILRTLYKFRSDNSWLLPITFGIYGGWVFIATIVNGAAYLESIDFQRFGMSQEIFYSILLIATIFLAILVQGYHKNAIFLLPMVWAFYGIYKALGPISSHKVIHMILIGGMIIFLLFIGKVFHKNKYKIYPKVFKPILK